MSTEQDADLIGRSILTPVECCIAFEFESVDCLRVCEGSAYRLKTRHPVTSTQLKGGF